MMFQADLKIEDGRTQSSDLIIGEADCPIGEIVKVILDDQVPLDKDKLSEITLHLRTPQTLKSTVLEKLNRSEDTIFDSIEKILMEWKQRDSREATLLTFIKHLRSCSLNNTANRLEEFFFSHNSNALSQAPLQSIVRIENETNESLQHVVVSESSAAHIDINPQTNSISVQVTDDILGPSLDQEVIILTEPLMNSESTVNEIPVAVISKDYKKQRIFDKRLCTILVICLACILFFLHKNNNLVTEMSGANATLIERHSNVNNSPNAIKYNFISEDNGSKLLWVDFDNHTALGQSVVFLVRTETEVLIKTNYELNEFLNSQENWDNLVSIEFDSALGLICQKIETSDVSSSNASSNFKRHFPKLSQLVLNFPRNCEYLFDIILNFFPKNQFVGFKYNGQIDDDAAQQIHEILHRNFRSLQEVNITGVLLSGTNVFEIRNSVTLNFVKAISLNLESFPDRGISKGTITERLCSIFPQLARLETKNISISLSELAKLQNCTTLEFLTGTIAVDRRDINEMERVNLKEIFPFLNFFALKLEFEVCPAFVFFERFIRNAELLPKYKLCSNCIMSQNRHERCHSKFKPV